MTSWLIGIDDTDTVDTPGTNKLALHLAESLGGTCRVELIARHQLLVDPRVPYTSHNGCASMLVEAPCETAEELAGRLAPEIVRWCPPGSDPALCIVRGDTVGGDVVEFGLRCQREVVTQDDAARSAEASVTSLESLGGSGDGVIGALAAVGLLATRNDGRILHVHCAGAPRWSDITGWQNLVDLLRFGVGEVRRVDTDQAICRGRVLVPKRLRPNLRRGEAVLFVERAIESTADDNSWQAVKVL